MEKDIYLERVIAYKYVIIKRIGEGTFGSIYYAKSKNSSEEVAIKIEPAKEKNNLLNYEFKIHKYFQGIEGFPKIYFFGQEGDINILVMEFLGKNLQEMIIKCGDKFSVITTCLSAIQMIKRIEQFHSKLFIHRDVKPENFLIGLGDKNKIIYLIDFGLAKRYMNKNSGLHIAFKEGKKLTGTARYASINTHKGYEQSRRDDLESLGYIFVYFFKGSLPWYDGDPFGINDKKMSVEKGIHIKMNTSKERLCFGCPGNF